MTSDSDKAKDGEELLPSAADADVSHDAVDGASHDAVSEASHDAASSVPHDAVDQNAELTEPGVSGDEVDAGWQADETTAIGRVDSHAADAGTARSPDTDGTDTLGYVDDGGHRAYSAAGDDGTDAEYGADNRYGDADHRSDHDYAPEDAPDPDDDGAGGASAAPTGRGHRHPLRSALIAVLVGAVAAGGVLLWSGAYTDTENEGVGTTAIGDQHAEENDFTRSEAGDCLQWNAKDPGAPSLADCTAPHRFEVVGDIDTEAYPTSEFADSAPWPGLERFATIRDETCPTAVDRYLGGGLDPQGRFAPGLMFPSKVQWERGARVLKCGIEQPGAKGVQEEFTGRVATADQSFSWPAGTCVGIDRATRKPAGEVVNCSEPHAFQTTGIVDLSHKFGDRNSGKPWPSVKDQNEYLKRICPTQTNRFFGGGDKFEDSTLNVQWSVISEVSWMTGSRRVVCYAALPHRGGFATLVGDARESLLVNGRVPVPPKDGPPGRSVHDPVPLPDGYTPNDQELPAPGGA
ncbi:septum formation family protein [Gordonia zhaorongruii]|uniref:septum formation family protein n=1 Tax=Gordonia zhaorongruii TaxID=2597659 RepID=UPI00104AD13B|nr:septum formation family protein [Gordonia zhaorongruii]